MSTEHEDQDNVVQLETQVTGILQREGALEILRSIRRDIRSAGEAGQALYALAPTEGRVNYLKNVMDQLTAQVFAMSIMLSRMMDDPEVEAELAAELEDPQ